VSDTGTSLGRIRTALRSGAREYRRTPVLLALIVGLPAYTIWVFTAVMPETTVPVHVGGERLTAGLAPLVTALMTPMTAALLAALAGLFLMQSAENDGRLVVAGYRIVEVVLARLALLGLISAVATVAALAVMATTFTPEQPLAFAVAVWLGALIYGMAGVVVGTTLDRLPGVYLVLFGSLVDLFLFQNPLAAEQRDVAALLPGHFPLEAATTAGFTGGVEPATYGLALLVLAVLTGLGTLAYVRHLDLG
jgi:ABC-2 type transport system permease protein